MLGNGSVSPIASRFSDAIAAEDISE